MIVQASEENNDICHFSLSIVIFDRLFSFIVKEMAVCDSVTLSRVLKSDITSRLPYICTTAMFGSR